MQRYRYTGSGAVSGVFEEYRYDALGRRVMVIDRHGTPTSSLCSPAALCSVLCNTGCVESVTRAVWDGASLAYEERRGYPSGALNSPAFGIVEYVHGVETDRPLAVLDATVSLGVRALSWTWRGMPEASTTASGTPADCSLGGGACAKIAWVDGNGKYGAAKEVGKKTPFGRRVIDVEVSRNGEVLGGIEAKAGKSRYLPWQMAKDEYLRRTGYPVQLVRDATAVKVSGLP